MVQENNPAESSKVIKKRKPRKPAPPAHNHIYLTNKTPFKAQLEKCTKLLMDGETEIILHGLGAAICRCVNLALQLQEQFNNVCKIEVNTSTVNLIDDIEPENDEGDFGNLVRQNSAVHIRVFKVVEAV